MADDSPLKSSFEIAMERLRKKDAEGGVTSRPVTDEQKAAIAEVRSLYDSKIAEQDVLQQSAVRRTLDPVERETLAAQFRRERERLASERDARIEKIRNQR
jgi:hypothetical protein